MRRATLLLVTALGAACASKPSPTHGHISDGFLSTYAHLAPDPVHPDVFVWRLPEADFSDYDTVLVEEPVMRRRIDDCLPSPEDRHAMCLALQASLESALGHRFTLRTSREGADLLQHRALRVKTAITAALLDRGSEPPEAERHGWGEVPSRFAMECEVLDASSARPLARMVAFDRTQWIPARQMTDWSACARDFDAWSQDVSWLVQPEGLEPLPAGGADPAAPAEAPAASDSERTPVST